MLGKTYSHEKKSVIKKLDKIYAQKLFLSNYAFSLYLFVDKLYTVCQKDKITDIFFLARDGYFLKQLYDEFANRAGCGNIKTHYMYVSRMSVVNSTLERLEDENFDWIVYYKISNIHKVLKVLQFSDEEISQISLSEDLFCEHKDLIHSSAFLALKDNAIFKKLYESKRVANKTNLELYLQKCGIYGAENPALVDLGWIGTIQDGLYRVLNKKILKGYYLGRYGKKGDDFCVKNGLLFDGYVANNPIIFKHHTFEYICIADHGTTCCYDNEGNPVMMDDGDIELFDSCYKKIQSSIKDKFIDIMEIVYKQNIPFDFERYVFSRHAKMLLSFTNSEKEVLAKNHIRKGTPIDKKVSKNLKYWLLELRTFLLLIYGKWYNDFRI